MNLRTGQLGNAGQGGGSLTDWPAEGWRGPGETVQRLRNKFTYFCFAQSRPEFLIDAN